MNKRLLVLIATICSVLSLASCGSGAHGGGFNIAQMYANLGSAPVTFNTTGLCTGSMSAVINPVYTNSTSTVPSSLIMYGNFGGTLTTDICGPGNYGGLKTPPLTTVTSNYGLPSAALEGASGVFYNYTQQINGTQANTGKVTWALSSDGKTVTLTDTNLSLTGATNYTLTLTFAISTTAAYTFNPTSLVITLPPGTVTAGGTTINGGVINGAVSTVSMPALNLQSAYQTLITSGWNWQNSYATSGSCVGGAGSLAIQQSIPTGTSGNSVNFNGGTSNADSAVYTQRGVNLVSVSGSDGLCSGNFFNGTQVTNYYNSTQVQLGSISGGITSVYTNANTPPTSLSSGPTHATFYTYTQPVNTGTIVFAVAPPATTSGAGSSPVLFSYEVNRNGDGSFNYADVTVFNVTNTPSLVPMAYSFTDSNGDNLTAN